MKIVVIHGDDSEKSWARLKKIIEVAKVRSWEILKFDATQKLLLSELLSSASLFTEKRLFVVESGKTIPKKDLEWLKINAKKFEGNLVIYFEDFIPIPTKNFLPKDTKFEEFKLPKIIFKFLDGIYPGNSKSSIILFHKLLSTEPPELLFNLVAKRLKELYWIKLAPDSLAYPSWRKNILKSQAAKFTGDKLEKLIAHMAEADVRAKTGDANIATLLDLIILTKLE